MAHLRNREWVNMRFDRSNQGQPSLPPQGESSVSILWLLPKDVVVARIGNIPASYSGDVLHVLSGRALLISFRYKTPAVSYLLQRE